MRNSLTLVDMDGQGRYDGYMDRLTLATAGQVRQLYESLTLLEKGLREHVAFKEPWYIMGVCVASIYPLT